MITVMETWYLKDADRALQIMQDMDELVGPNAHDDPGWCGHAQFFQHTDQPDQVIMIYPWRSQVLHESLCETEEDLLAEFVAANCERPRTIQYLAELPVETEHDHDHH